MRSRSRRAFLATVGAVSIGGCATKLPTSGSETTDKSTTSTSSSPPTSTTQRDGPGTPSQPQTFEGFERLEKWRTLDQQGTLKASSDAYQGSRAAHIVGHEQTHVGEIFRTDFGGGSVDLSGRNLSLMYKCTSHDFSKIAVRLYAPDRGHVVTLKRTLYGPKGKWVRVNLGVTDDQRAQSIDLSRVYEIRITGRPVDSNTTEPIEFYVDDLKTVPAPKTGKVMLTFDDARESHYSAAYEMMKQYGFPGVEAVITEAVYDDGFLTQGQMREMVEDGWDMICHPNTQAMPMDERSREDQENLMKQSQDWLKRYGYEGHKYMAVPKNVVGPNTFELAQKYFDATMTFGGSPNALPAITKDTLLSRIYGDDSLQVTKSAIDRAARYNQLTVLLFHEVGGDGIPKQEFKAVLDYLKRSNVEVVTLTDLKDQGLLI